jgi:hypothetical protein
MGVKSKQAVMEEEKMCSLEGLSACCESNAAQLADHHPQAEPALYAIW